MSSNRRKLIFPLYNFFLWNSFILYCSASDTITSNSSISDGRGETLVSIGERFQLGFFTPNESSSFSRYVGIWYFNSNPWTVVWVANRDAPLSDRSGVFTIKEDGNLEVLDGKGKSYWSTKLQRSSYSSWAKLMDSGNLVLGNDSSDGTLWESFHNPTDTFLPGMKMDETLKLISWKSPNDPSPGEFTFEKYVEGVGQFITLRRSVRYWRSGQNGNYLNSDQMPSIVHNLLSNFNTSDNFLNYTTRLVMKFNGEIQYLSWDSKKGWSLNWWEPRNLCNVFDTCGKFGSCNSNNGLSLCKCLPGFEPGLQDKWNSGNYSGGCTRKTPLRCDNVENASDTFLNLKMMQVRNPGTEFQVANENECRKECLSRCDCQAYAYDVPRNYTGQGSSNSTAVCWIWTDDLSNLKEESAHGAPSLYARVAISDIEPTPRTCEPCGTYMIPYPLSTGPNCGDPLYSSFNCNMSTAQVNFNAPNGTYRVTSINMASHYFVIQAKVADNCEATSSTGKLVQLIQSLPYHVNMCNANSKYSGSPTLGKSKDEVELGWDPPPEPTCTLLTDCNDWPNSSCKMAKDGKKRCLCNSNFKWSSAGFICTHEGPSRRKVAIVAATCATAIALTALLCTIFCIKRKRRVAKRHGDGEKFQRNQVLHLHESDPRVKDLIESNNFTEDDKIGIDVPFFDLESILAATNNFSDANKLGQGGFGTVYKGNFQEKQQMAVKRLTRFSGQGLVEFKNEVMLIAKLQHRNLVSLLGYCVKGEETILLYEYMANKSLDAFLFDRTLCVLLNWESRFNIILGIARGLLYLHQDSKLRIVHRDLKTSNILLDEEMTPKISDFGLARIFGGKQTESTTSRVIGTFGYMAPEYALDGVFSDKSDVFSFGVVVLEIISGKRNTGFYQTQQATSLLNFAWKLWNEDKALDLMDQTLHDTCTTSQVLKCIHVGLLCVQEDPRDRPTMANVVVMLGSGTATLPTPAQPTFMMRRWSSNTTNSSTKPESCSNSQLILTIDEVR